MRRRWGIAVAGLVLLAGCGAQPDPVAGQRLSPEQVAEVGYLDPGSELIDGWTVPDGTTVVGAAYVDETYADTGFVYATAIVSDDGYAVLRNLFGQITGRGLTPMTEGGSKPCTEASETLSCAVSAVGDSRIRMDAELTVDSGAARLWLRFHHNAGGDPAGELAVVEPPSGDAPVPHPDERSTGSAPTDTFATPSPDGTIAELPSGARLLAAPAPAPDGSGTETLLINTGDPAESEAGLRDWLDAVTGGDSTTTGTALGESAYRTQVWAAGPDGCAGSLISWVNPADARLYRIEVDCG